MVNSLDWDVRHAPFSIRSLVIAYIFLQLLCFRLRCIALGCKIRYLLFKGAYFGLQTRHFLFQQRNMISEDGCRSVFFDPFFDYREWIHI